MSLFKRKIKISTENMGYVVCELARLRSENLISLFKKEHYSNYNFTLVQIFVFIYNFYIVETILLKKYSKNKVDEIMFYAYKLFYNMTSEFLEENEINTIMEMRQFTYLSLDDLLSKTHTDSFKNIFSEMAKMFLEDISNKKESLIDSLKIMNMTIEITGWYDSMFLINEYRLISN